MYKLSEAQRQELARIADEASVEFVREARSEGTPEMALENAFLPFVQRIAEAAHADGCRETVETLSKHWPINVMDNDAESHGECICGGARAANRRGG